MLPERFNVNFRLLKTIHLHLLVCYLNGMLLSTYSFIINLFIYLLLIIVQRDATQKSIYYSASSLYMFRVSTTPIIRSTQKFNYSLRYWSYFLCSYLPAQKYDQYRRL